MCGALSAAFRRIVGIVVFRGAKLLGRVALPVLVRKAAMGADEGRFLEVRPLPPGVSQAEPMSTDLLAAVAGISGSLGGTAGQALLRAITRRDPFAIKLRVSEVLQTPKLRTATTTAQGKSAPALRTSSRDPLRHQRSPSRR